MLMQPYRPNDAVAKALGLVLLLPVLPLVMLQIAVAVTWEFLDVRVLGVQDFLKWFNAKVRYHHLTLHEEDEFMVNVMFLNGVLIPMFFMVEAHNCMVNGFSWERMLLYNIVRFGPNVSNFAWVNTLIHKSCHGRIFKTRALDSIFEFWIGNFYGSVPGNYAISHVYNHHKHDNSKEDVITVVDFPRDSVLSFIGYVYRYMVYSLNISSAVYFVNREEYTKALKIIACTLYYFAFMGLAYVVVGPMFALFYVAYPLLQCNLIMSAINYTWHAFIQPSDEQNRLINSTTVVNGQYFILDEEYHAVHHMYAGIHWTKHKQMYEKHEHDCKENPTVFYNVTVFELWFWIISGDYEAMHNNSKIDRQVLRQRLSHVSTA